MPLGSIAEPQLKEIMGQSTVKQVKQFLKDLNKRLDGVSLMELTLIAPRVAVGMVSTGSRIREIVFCLRWKEPFC